MFIVTWSPVESRKESGDQVGEEMTEEKKGTSEKIEKKNSEGN